MKVLVGAFNNQENALAGASSVIVKLRVIFAKVGCELCQIASVVLMPRYLTSHLSPPLSLSSRQPGAGHGDETSK